MATVADSKTKIKSEALCFARRHMSMAASAYHSYAFAVSRSSGVFYSDDRRDAQGFGEDGVSNRTIFDLRRFLERKGWFIRINKGRARRRNRITGSFESIQYRVLSHNEWAAAHPGHCRFSDSVLPDAKSTAGPDVESTAGNPPPDANSASTSRKFRNHLQQILPTPAADSAAKNVIRETEVRKTEEESLKRAAAPQTGAVLIQTTAIEASEVANFWAVAFEHGWKKFQVQELLKDRFGTVLVGELSKDQCQSAVEQIECGPLVLSLRFRCQHCRLPVEQCLCLRS